MEINTSIFVVSLEYKKNVDRTDLYPVLVSLYRQAVAGFFPENVRAPKA